MSTPEKPKKKMGRPVLEIDWLDFEKLCGMQCTAIEIAAWFHVSVDTVERRVKEQYGTTFAEVFAEKSFKGKASLRRKMYELAMTGDRVMLIWLSKQYLGFSEKMEQKSDTTVVVKEQEKQKAIQTAKEILTLVGPLAVDNAKSA